MKEWKWEDLYDAYSEYDTEDKTDCLHSSHTHNMACKLGIRILHKQQTLPRFPLVQSRLDKSCISSSTTWQTLLTFLLEPAVICTKIMIIIIIIIIIKHVSKQESQKETNYMISVWLNKKFNRKWKTTERVVLNMSVILLWLIKACHF